MNESKITLFFFPKRITLMNTLFPIYFSKYKNHFDFISDINYLIKKDKNKKLLLVGGQTFWTSNRENLELFLRLREKYSKIVFFEDNASPESQMFNFLPHIDLLLKRSIYVDKDNYKKQFVGNRLFTDFYYHNYKFGEITESESYPKLQNTEDLDKIQLGWNIGFGYYPLSKNRNRLIYYLYKLFGGFGLGVIPYKSLFNREIPNPSLQKCQARFDYKGYRTLIGFQRKKILEIINGDSIFLEGKIPLKEYNKEILNVQAMLSPFGWGEVCFRDFEAVFNGAVLIKPNMDHLITYPNIFIPDYSYIAVDWHGNDLMQKTNAILNDSKKMNEIKTNAWNIMADAYLNIDSRVKELIEKINN